MGAKLANALGEWCARSGFHVLTGGGGGVMTSVSRAFAETCERERRAQECGLALAVLPGLPAAHAEEWASVREKVTSKLLVDQSNGSLSFSVITGSSEPDEAIVPPQGYPNDFVDVAVRTHLPSSGTAADSILARTHICVLSSDVLVALPGGPGTASEVRLALQYGIPVCRFLGSDGSIQSLSGTEASRAPLCKDLDTMQEFVLAALRGEFKRPPKKRFMRTNTLERNLSG